MKHLPTSDNDKYHGSYPSKVSAALDLAQLSRASSQPGDSRDSPAKWSQFARTPEGISRSERRTVTNPNLTVSAPTDDVSPHLGGTGSASGTPLISQGPSSRRGSPHSLLETLSATRSVPATPLGLPPNMLKTPGTPNPSEVQPFNGRIPTPNSQMVSENAMGNIELQGALSRHPHASYDNGNLSYNVQAHLDDVCFDYMCAVWLS
jgi:hypothetical protein